MKIGTQTATNICNISNLTERQRKLLTIAIDNLRNISGVMGIERHTVGLNYDNSDQDLSCLGDDLEIEFNL